MSVLQTVQKNNRQFTYGQTVQKNNKQFTYGQTVQKNNKQFTYGQTVQKNNKQFTYGQTVQKNNKQFTYGQTVQKNNKQFTYGQTVQKNNKQFTYGQTVQRNCTGAFTVLQTVQKKQQQFTYGQTVQKKQQTIYIWTVHIYRVVALHKDGVGYKKFNNSLELQYSGQGHTEVFQDGFHSEQASQGSIKEVVLVLWVRCRSWLQKHECCLHCFRGCRSGRSACQCSDYTPRTATSRFASSQKEASSEAGSQKTGYHPSCSKKKKKMWCAIPASTPHVCGLMQMIIIDGQLCPWKDIRNPAQRKVKGWKRSLCVTFIIL